MAEAELGDAGDAAVMFGAPPLREDPNPQLELNWTHDNRRAKPGRTRITLRCPLCRERNVVSAIGGQSALTEGLEGASPFFALSAGAVQIVRCGVCSETVVLWLHLARHVPGAPIRAFATDYSPRALPVVPVGVPDRIREIVDEAARCFSSGAHRATAVMARRVVAMVIEDQGLGDKNGTAKATLRDKLIELDQAHRLAPGDPGAWADALSGAWERGNAGAHANVEDAFGPVTAEQSAAILKLLLTMLGDIYNRAAMHAEALGVLGAFAKPRA